MLNQHRLRPQARAGGQSPKATPSAQRGGEWKGAPPSEVINGGAGICTRVRKYIPAGIYDAYPPLSCRARREEAEQPPGTNPEKSRR